MKLAAAAAMIPRLFLGNIDQSPHVMRMSGPRFAIERTGPGLIHTDGETRIEVRGAHRATPADKMIGDVHYLNSGDWVESLTAIVEHGDGRFELIDFARFVRLFQCLKTMTWWRQRSKTRDRITPPGVRDLWLRIIAAKVFARFL